MEKNKCVAIQVGIRSEYDTLLSETPRSKYNDCLK